MAPTLSSRDPNRTRTHAVPQEPEFISTIKARSMIRAQLAAQQQQTVDVQRAVVLTESGGQWRATTAWGALVESHFCYTECARRAKLKGFVPVSAA